MGAKSKLGFIPDRPFIYEKLTGSEFLRFVASLYKQEGADVERRGNELLALFDLLEWKDELVESYSHGMRQKLIISSAFVHRPEVIIVDEPMVGLDPKAAHILKELFREYVARGNTIMMSTHTLEVAESMCDRVAIIQRGRIRALGTMAGAAKRGQRRHRRARRHLPATHRCDRCARRRCGARSLTTVLRDLVRVLRPKLLTVRARARSGARGRGLRIGILGVLAAAFWLLVFGIMARLLHYFRNVPELGALLAAKLLGVILLSFFGLLLLSNIITSLSTFFLARDLDLLVGTPVDWLAVYCAKVAETAVSSGWMVLLMVVPILAAYGTTYDGGWWFPLLALFALAPFFLIPGAVGAALTLLLVNALPARRAREILSVIAVVAAGGVVLLFRAVRPERIVRPEGFRSLVDFLAALRAPNSQWLPSTWVQNAIMSWLRYEPDALSFYLLWSTAAAAVVAGALLHRALYERGYSKSQQGGSRTRGDSRVTRGYISRLLRVIPTTRRELLTKEVRIFFRDTTQWSQLVLLIVLVVVYVFNIRLLPLNGDGVTFFLANVVPFLNLILAGFVLASIAARFIFPSVSLEGRTWWLLKASPLSMRDLLWAKFWVGTIPLLVLALAIVVTTDVLLRVSEFMTVVSIGTITLMTFAISGLAMGMGTMFPQFETENAAQIPTSFGGLVFMMTTVTMIGVVIMLEARPVYLYLSALSFGTPMDPAELWAGFGTAASVCLLATFAPITMAVRRLESFDR